MKKVILTVSIFSFLSSQAFAREPDDKAMMGLVWENDAFSGKDSGYTNGARLFYVSSEKNVPQFVKDFSDYLPVLDAEGKKRMGISLGQSMFTPENIEVNPPPANDRPYAGWLYASFGIYSDTDKSLDNLMLTLGIVGPEAGAKRTQKFVHHVIGAEDPRGWDYQLKNEPGVVLTYEKKWRNISQLSDTMQGDIMPHAGVNLGNVNTDATLGATFRLGYDLQSDYGAPRIRPGMSGSDFFNPSQNLGGYLFAGFEARAVARNIFLDGNTSRNSPEVDKRHMVYSMQFGFAVNYKDMRLSYSQVFMTEEFYDQAGGGDQFGVLTLSSRF